MKRQAWNEASIPCIIESGLGEPLIRMARGSRSSGSMLRIEPWESLTTTSVAPASSAPSTAALTSWAIHFRPAAYSAVPDVVWSLWTIPEIPSISTEMKTLSVGFGFCCAAVRAPLNAAATAVIEQNMMNVTRNFFTRPPSPLNRPFGARKARFRPELSGCFAVILLKKN
jgi:hypothetical protein